VLPGQIRVARDLLQHRIQLSRSGGDPLQILVIQHKGKRLSGFVAIVAAGQKNTTEHGKNSDGEGTDCEHEKRRLGQHGSCP
jgi:hypothetical protein